MPKPTEDFEGEISKSELLQFAESFNCPRCWTIATEYCEQNSENVNHSMLYPEAEQQYTKYSNPKQALIVES